MSRLIPEQRVNKNGVAVVKHVRADNPPQSNRFLTRRIPALNNSYSIMLEERREQLLSALVAELQAESDKVKSDWEKAAQDDIELAVRLLSSGILDDGAPIAVKTRRLKKLSSGTLEMLYETFHGTGGLTNFMNLAPDSEDDLRAAVTFDNCGLVSTARRIFEDVRISTGFSDLSAIEPGSKTHQSVSAVFKIAVEVYDRRCKALAERVLIVLPSAYEEEKKHAVMTPDLAEVILEYSDRTEEVLVYITKQAEDDVERVNGEHLRLYLNNPSPSLSEGVL